jgi:methylthioribose-1-phosphate isomerase
MDPDLLRSAVDWRDGRLEAIDQTRLPERLVVLELTSVAEVVDALARLAVRGAPAIGVAGAFGVVLGLAEAGPPRPGPEGLAAAQADLERVAGILAAARPTAVNLGWAVRRVVAAAAGATDAAELRRRALAEAEAVLAEDREACRRMAEAGRAELASRRRLLTHCNTGRLATAGIGTALGVVYAKAAAGEPVEVLASETRPLLQGARLTAWELVNAGIPVTVVADTAAGAAMAGGMVDAVLVGCDRVAANGDTANKIGTYSLAVLARANRLPFYVVGPLSSFDPGAADGGQIVIEQRPADEVASLAATRLAPGAAAVWNPAFDVTPAGLVTAFITDAGVLRPPFPASIARALAGQPMIV